MSNHETKVLSEGSINGKCRAYPNGVGVGEIVNLSGGVSKRELFAAMAMQGLLANGPFLQQCANDKKYIKKGELAIFVSKIALAHADTLLEELAK